MKPMQPQPPTRGPRRPNKAAKSRASAAAAAKAEVELEELAAAAVVQEDQWEAGKAEQERRQQKRPVGNTNWSLTKNQAVLAPAVTGWLDGTAKLQNMSMVKWCAHHSTDHSVQIKKGTLSMYVTRNESKRLKLVRDGGTGPGSSPTLAHDKGLLLVDVIFRAGGGNKPKLLTQIVDTIRELDPTISISRMAARQAYSTSTIASG